MSFTSKRKRMSVVVKEKKGYHLYIKGADNVIFQRLKKDNKTQNGKQKVEQTCGYIGCRWLTDISAGT